jgi:nitrate reductase gamma subunit
MPGLLPMLAWGLLALFLVAFVVRTVRIARLPVHLRWELAPVPKEKTRGKYGGSYLEEYEWWRKPREESRLTELVYMLKEIVFLKALHEHNRRLWWFSFPFHMGLYLLIVAGALLVAGGALSAAGRSVPELGGVVGALALAGNGLGIAGAAGLFGSRLIDGKLRRFTTPVAFFNLLLLAAVFGTGVAAVLSVDEFGIRVVGLAAGVLRGRSPELVPGLLAGHAALVVVFLAVLPFGQMMHFVAKYFTYHQVRWDDRPLEAGSSLEREVREMLGRPVTWSAAHVGADGVKTWADIATQDTAK